MKINKVWLLPLIVLFALAFTPALAQETLPEAGTGFEGAVKLEPGSYIEGEIGRETNQYYLLEDIKAGQLVEIVGTVENSDNLEYADYRLKILNQNRSELLSDSPGSDEQKAELNWSPGTNKVGNDYYLKVFAGKIWGEDEKVKYSLDYNVEDNFDAGTNKDAGENIEQAIKVEPGSYTGYLFGSDHEGADRVDSYKFDLNSDEKMTVKITPPTEGLAGLYFLNNKREATDETTGTNVGAITEASFYPQESGTHYVRIKMDDIAKGKPGEYDISFSKEEVEQQETQTETTETTEEIPEEVKEQLPENWEENLPEDVKKEFKDLEGKSPEEIKKELKKNLPKNYYNMITGEKSVVQGLKSMVFNFLKKVLMWFAGLVVLIIIIVIIFKKLGSSDSEEKDKEKVEENKKSKDKGPNKSDN